MSKMHRFQKLDRFQILTLGFNTCAVLIMMLGCVSTSYLSNMWRDPSYQLGPMQNMLIVAMKKDPVRRRLWEDGFVAALGKHGVAATPWTAPLKLDEIC